MRKKNKILTSLFRNQIDIFENSRKNYKCLFFLPKMKEKNQKLK